MRFAFALRPFPPPFVDGVAVGIVLGAALVTRVAVAAAFARLRYAFFTVDFGGAFVARRFAFLAVCLGMRLSPAESGHKRD
jgi:hypothetical protein